MCAIVKRTLFVLVLLLVSASLFSQDTKALEEQRLNTIRYGTEAEIASLVQTLKNENVQSLDSELLTLAENTRNRAILTGLFSFFGDREKTGLEERARRAVAERDREETETVLAATGYLGSVKDASALDSLKELLSGADQRFTAAAVRSFARIASGIAAAGGGAASGEAEYLIDLYQKGNQSDEIRREITTALGETRATEASSFLQGLAENSGERPPIRIAALEALGKIGDPGAAGAVAAAASSPDPNVRAAAISALGPFTGEDAERLILEAFRDSYYRTRIAAAKAAGERKLAAAVPYLSYRAERDEVPAVKDEAIRALAAIGSGESTGILEGLFKEQKNSDRTRILAAEMLTASRPDDFTEAVIQAMREARLKNQTALYNGFLKAAAAAKTPKVLSLAEQFLSSGGAVEKSYALDIIVNNSFRQLAAQVQALAGDRNSGLASKARITLEKMGIE